MELNEFARQILFAESLDLKLAAPAEEITDGAPGSPLLRVDQPGRPLQLRFRRESAPPMPSEHALQSEEERIVLLHFFANHELLATELMALALLRFPTAPAEFRAGVFRTLREEQRHTLWYMRRIQECGAEFGDLPVNDFFWKAVSTMASPLDYVARLCLTFEQANLDYALYYSQVLRHSGDAKSAKILGQIYEDEIDHVSYGLHWFRQWKPPGLGDWEAFQQALPFPLSPSRAKANGRSPFNAAGRKRAGLTDSFVQELQHFERSKGRTPSLFYFCPDAEASMAGGLTQRSVPATKVARGLAQDLEILCAFLCARDDVLLVREMPSLSHRQKLASAGFQLPELERLGEDGCLAPDSLSRTRKLDRLCPWAWCPDSAALLAPLRDNLSPAARTAPSSWNESIRALFSKATGQELARRLQESAPLPEAEPGTIGRAVQSIEELQLAIDDLRRAGHDECLVKAPFGASGQANHRWQNGRILPWCQRTLKWQGCLLVEPLLDRVFDFSVHFQRAAAGTRLLGFVRLENDARGQFRAAEAGPKFCHGLPPALARLLGSRIFPYFRETLPAFLEAVLAPLAYTGPLGIDSFIYRNREGELRVKPVVELNPRFTMGRVILELQKRWAPSKHARLELRKTRLPEANPPAVLDSATGKLLQADLLLNEPRSSSPVFARLVVGGNSPGSGAGGMEKPIVT